MKIIQKIEKYRFEFLSFVLPVAAWAIIFAFWGQYPFGDKTLLIWDADFQYVSFMAKWHDILHGRAGLFYSLSDSIGGNAFSIGAYYYMFSPLNLLVFFFKKDSLYKCFCLIFFLKMGFMGSSFYHYLGLRYEGMNEAAGIHLNPGYGAKNGAAGTDLNSGYEAKNRTAGIHMNPAYEGKLRAVGIPLTLAYTLSSYVVAYMFNSMWLDALILLPMVIAGADRILSGKDKPVTAEQSPSGKDIPVTSGHTLSGKDKPVTAEHNPSEKDIPVTSEHTLSGKDKPVTAEQSPSGKDIPMTSGHTLSGKDISASPDTHLAMLIAAAVITNFYTSVIIAIFTFLYFVLGVILENSGSRLRKLICFTSSMAVGIGMAGVVIVPCFFAMMRGSRFSGIIDMSEVNDNTLGNFLWGSMPVNQVTQGIPLYYCGTIVFALCLVFFISKKIDLVRKVHCGLLLSVIFMSTRFRALDVVWGLGHETSGCPYRYSFVAVFIFCVIAADALVALLSEKSRMNVVCYAVAAVICLDLVSNALHFYSRSYEHHSRGAAEYTEASKWLMNIHSMAEPDSRYRIEYGYYPNLLLHNIPFFMNTHGVSAYSSMEENQKVNVVEKLGYVGSYDGYNIEFNENNTLASGALLGIKYLVTSNELDNAALLAEDKELRLYDLQTAFPVAFSAGESFSDVSCSDHKDYFSWMNELYSMIIGKEIRVFEPLSVDSVYLADGEIDGDPYSFMALSDNAQIIVNLAYDGEKEKTAYLRYGFEETQAPRLDVYLNGEDVDIEGQENTVKVVGSMDRESLLVLAVTVSMGQSFDMEKLGICVEDTDTVKEVSDFINVQERSFIKLKDGNLELKVASQENELLVVSIPNDDGWSVYLDGKKTDRPLDVVEGLMGIPIAAGEHVVRLKYQPPGLVPGIMLSLLCCGICFLCERKPKKNTD